MINNNPISKQYRIFFLKPAQGFCFYIIALNLLWAYFADSPLSSLFSLACIAMFGFMVLNILLNATRPVKPTTLLCYAGFLAWSAIMIGVYGFLYPSGSVTNFLIFNMPSYGIFFIRLFVSVLPCMVFADMIEYSVDKKARVTMFIVLFVSVLLTSKAVAINPDALRARASMEAEGLEDLLKGTPAYAITYSYALLLPVFLHKCRLSENKIRTFYIICTVMMIYILIVAQYATALILALVGALVYALLVSKPKNRVRIIIATIGIILVLNITGGVSGIFQSLSKYVEGSWATKLNDIALTLEGQQDSGSVSGRTDLYSKSLAAFLQSPIFGKYTKDTGPIGGHAIAIDVLGLTGIVGFIFMAASVYGNFARMKNHPSYKTSKPAVIASMVEFIVLIFSKNIVTSMAIFFTFFVLIPLLLKSKESGENEFDKENSI